MVVQKNGSKIYRWMVGILAGALLTAGGLVYGALDAKVDSVKADSLRERIHIEARVDANTADLVEIKGDVKLIKYQTQEILNLLKNGKDST